MKKFILLLILIISYKIYFYNEIKAIEIRADYLIQLLEEYKVNTGEYPTDVDEILITHYADYMMVDSKDIPGKGYFIILSNMAGQDEYGNILVVGGWNPPNIVYFPKIKKKEINSTYFSSKF